MCSCALCFDCDCMWCVCARACARACVHACVCVCALSVIVCGLRLKSCRRVRPASPAATASPPSEPRSFELPREGRSEGGHRTGGSEPCHTPIHRHTFRSNRTPPCSRFAPCIRMLIGASICPSAPLSDKARIRPLQDRRPSQPPMAFSGSGRRGDEQRAHSRLVAAAEKRAEEEEGGEKTAKGWAGSRRLGAALAGHGDGCGAGPEIDAGQGREEGKGGGQGGAAILIHGVVAALGRPESRRWSRATAQSGRSTSRHWRLASAGI